VSHHPDDLGELPAAAHGHVARRYRLARAYGDTQAERDALLAAAERAAARQRHEIACDDDIFDHDPLASAVSGVCVVVLCGGFLAFAIAALIRWLGGVLQ